MTEVTIEQQLELEANMMARGVESYRRQKEAAINGGRGHETGFARRLMDQYMEPLLAAHHEWMTLKGARQRARAKVHLEGIAGDKAIFIALRNILGSFQKPTTPTNIANDIGRMIEDEVRFTRFSDKYANYYDDIRLDFKKKGSKDYRYMHRVLTHAANNHEGGDNWQPWSIGERVDVGMRLIDLVRANTDLINLETHYARGKTQYTISPTDQALDFINRYDEAASLLHPRHMPCIIKPDHWTALDQGGYYSPQLRSSTRLVQANNREHRRLLKKADLSTVMGAVNVAQDVSWRVNTRVLEIARAVWAKNLQVGMPSTKPLKPDECPVEGKKKEEMNAEEMRIFMEWKRSASLIYTAEKERAGSCFQVSAILRAANEYAAYDSFWYVWFLDFRGRMYTTTSGFSPQGPDLAKGMLTFQEGVPLGERGVFWLKVHGANRYGFDKADYADRVAWIDAQHDKWMAAAADPLGNVEAWAGADKPYQFLAWLFEYKGMMDGKLIGKVPADYVSHLPVGLDGSCNGLQHFSAMLRDTRGGKATNLVPAAKPSDIYREVADVCLTKIVQLGQDLVMQKWISFAQLHGEGKLPRSVAKRPVMTMPYGSTRQSCTTYIHASILEYDPKHFGSNESFAAATALTPLLWTSIGEVVVAARQGMDWLQKCASVMSKNGLGITWRTKDGFVVHMFERELDQVVVKTALAGAYWCKVNSYSERLNKNRQRNGVAPNFVHSQDASHLRATCLKAAALGIKSLALIHDDYGTHAAHTDILHRLIREAFVEQYTEFDPLNSFQQWCEAISKAKCPAQPARGNLDINAVLDSEFFFG